MSACSILDLGQGRMSTFGGPEDQGVGLHEGLALISENDVTLSRYAHLFMSVEAAALVIAKRENIPAPAKIGMARRLNPLAFYLAMRWDQALAPFRHVYRNSDNTVNAQTFTILRHGIVRLTNPENGFCLFATPVDYGPRRRPRDRWQADARHGPDRGPVAGRGEVSVAPNRRHRAVRVDFAGAGI